MSVAAAYPESPTACAHRGENHPLTTPVNHFVYSPAHRDVVCRACGTLAVRACGGLYHPESQ